LTAACLERDGIRYHSLTFTADKTDVWTDMMVDDKPENYYDLIKAGTDAYLLTRDWNKHIEGAKRVRSVGEFSRKVLEKVDSANPA
jgi:5'(3')-deoxyribonucleotidase